MQDKEQVTVTAAPADQVSLAPGRMSRWEKAALIAAALVVVGIVVVATVRPDLVRSKVEVVVPGLQQPAAAPAPTQRKDGITMADFTVADAGSDVNGDYSAAGILNGEIYYERSPGGPAIWWYIDGGAWMISTTAGAMPPLYQGTGANLPANPWAQAGGALPVPSVSASTPAWWFDDAPFVPAPNAIRPCIAVIGGVDLHVFAHQATVEGTERNGFIAIRMPDYAKGWCEVGEEIAPNHDPWQTAFLADDGDGSHIWLNTGVYTTASPAFTGFSWTKFAITPAVSAAPVVTADCPLPSDDVSSFLSMGLGEFWFVMVEGGVPKLCSCEAGGTSYTVLATYGSESDLPAGLYQVTFPDTSRGDHALSWFPDTETVYWSRRASNDAGGAGAHRFVFYAVDAEGCERQADVVPVSTNSGIPQPGMHLTQSWGVPKDSGVLYGRIGMSTSLVTVRWKPGVSSAEGEPYWVTNPERLLNPPPEGAPLPTAGGTYRSWLVHEEV